MRLRRIATMGAVVALTVVSGASLPDSSAYLNGASGAPSNFGVGEFGEEEGSLVEVAYGALCGVTGQDPCPEAPADFVPPWLAPSSSIPAAEPAPAPAPAAGEPEAAPSPSASPSPRPSHLPRPGERCDNPDCVEEAVHVVGLFAEELQDLHEREPGGVPEEAVRAIAAFAEDLRALPERGDDVALPEETREALEALVEAGVLERFTPECVANVGQLAALIGERQASAEAAAAGGDPAPEPSPTATCSPAPESGEQASAEPAAEPSPEPGPAPQTQPQPGTEPEPASSGEPTEYPYDGPGHRVRSA